MGAGAEVDASAPSAELPEPEPEPFLALRRKLLRRLTAAPLAEAAALLSAFDGSGSSGRPKRDEGGASPDAARAASMPVNLDVLDRRPDTRGRR